MDNLIEKSQNPWLTPETIKAIAALAATQVAVGATPVLIRLSEGEISPNTTIFNRLLIGTAFLALWNGLLQAARKLLGNKSSTQTQQIYSKEVMWLLFALGFCICAYQVVWAWSLTQTSIANSALMHSLLPLFTASIGILFFAQHLDRPLVIGTIIAISGTFTVAFNDLQISADKLQGDGIALISALLTALCLLIAEKLQKSLNAITITIGSCSIAILFGFALVLLVGDRIFPHSWDGWLEVIGLGLTLIINQQLINYSLNRLSANFVALTFLLDPALAALLGWVVFSETLNLYNFLGFVVVLLGMYITTLSKVTLKV